jgi:uncharacterized UPF0146 family protein
MELLLIPHRRVPTVYIPYILYCGIYTVGNPCELDKPGLKVSSALKANNFIHLLLQIQILVDMELLVIPVNRTTRV